MRLVKKLATNDYFKARKNLSILMIMLRIFKGFKVLNLL